MAVNINVPSQVKTYANLAAFPATGALKTIYIAEDTNKTYRWTGSVYVEVSASASGITIGTTAITSGTVGRVLFQGAGNVVQESSSLFWDATNNRLGVGTETPLNPIHAFGNINANYTGINVSNQSIGNSAISTIQVSNDTGAFTIQAIGSGYTPSGVLQPNSARFRSSAALANGFFMGTSSGNLVLFTNDNERLRVRETTGNVLIGTTTDAGFKLDVNGTARVQNDVLLTTGILATSAGTTRLQSVLNFFSHNRLGSSGSFGWDIRTLGTQNSFWRYNTSSGNTEFGSNFYGLEFYGANTLRTTMTSGGNWLINTTADNGFKLDVNGTARVQNVLTIQNLTADLYVRTTAWSGQSRIWFGDDSSDTIGGINYEHQFDRMNLRTNAGTRMTLFSTGNVGINTTTDAGFRLDVNGTARVVNNILSGNGTYFTTGSQSIASASTANAFMEISSGASSSGSLVWSKAGSLSTLWQLYSDSSNNIAFFRNGVNKEIFKIFESTKNVGIDETSGSASFTDVSSAKLFVNSTTKGFLPPRMTTTQKNAIATPAAGLMVYDTTLNVISYYNGSMWI